MVASAITGCVRVTLGGLADIAASPRKRLDAAIHQRPTGKPGGDRLWVEEKTRLTVQKGAGKGDGM